MDGVPFRRAVISHLGNRVARFLFRLGIRDCTNGFRAIRVPLLARMKLRENGFPIIVEELYQCVFLASSFVEIPVVLTNRSNDLRPTSFSYSGRTLAAYLTFAIKAWFRIKPEGMKHAN
jgi:hypothetical protein